MMSPLDALPGSWQVEPFLVLRNCFQQQKRREVIDLPFLFASKLVFTNQVSYGVGRYAE